MSEGRPDSSAQQQVELAAARIEAVSILPCVIGRFLARLNSFELTPGSLAELIEADPALTVAVLFLAAGHGRTGGSVRSVLDRLELRELRDRLISAKPYGLGEPDEGKIEFRKQITRHSIAVAYSARRLAKALGAGPAIPPVNVDSAYLAGLLHDIGKLALDEAMPKSFERIVEEAKTTNAAGWAIEQKYLGVDHAIIGKRLAQRLGLAPDVILGIWLHHSNTQAVSQALPEASFARVVRLADCMAREAEIGESGSYDTPTAQPELAESLGITAGQLAQIAAGLAETVDDKARLLGLDLPDPQAAYCDALRTTAAGLADETGRLLSENQQLQGGASHFNFINELLQRTRSASPLGAGSPADVIEAVAMCWQKSFQTGAVCLYLAPSVPGESTAAFALETAEEKTLTYVKVPQQAALGLQDQTGEFEIFDAEGRVEWLFEQIDAEFDLGKSKLVPLTAAGREIGGLIFEPGYPASIEQLTETLRPAASLAAIILDSAAGLHKQQWFAERFAQLLTSPPIRTKPANVDESAVLDALAEMAAGAAHELNNPLSVISGRAQLLAQSEQDDEKKRILGRIQQTAGELSGIIDDLMSYANPPKPRPAPTPVKQILEEAVELTSQEQQTAKTDIRLDIAGQTREVAVDSAQVASAIANILSNALESYQGGTGEVKVSAANDQAGSSVKVTVSDTGCGMDAATLERATYPFFSARAAGRKRGMGLAHTQRLLQINGGTLKIISRPDRGTTVTISLPC